MKTLTKKTGKLALALVLAISMLLSLASCTPGTQPPPEPEKPTSYFILQLENEDVLADSNGNEIMRAERLDFPYSYSTNLYVKDYVMATQLIESEEAGAPPIPNVALYKADGTQLFDFEECRYYSAFGEFIIKSNDVYYELYFHTEDESHYSNLINVNTGEVLIEDVWSCEMLDETTFALRTKDGIVKYIVDVNGNILHTFAEEDQYSGITIFGDYYIVMINNLQLNTLEYFILDTNFTPVPVGNKSYNYIFAGEGVPTSTDYPYALASYNGFDVDVIDVTTGEVVLTGVGVHSYFENCYVASVMPEATADSIGIGLYSTDGTLYATWSGYYAVLSPTENMPRRFCFADLETGDVVVMDDTGTVLAQEHLADDVFWVRNRGNLIEISFEYIDDTFLVDENLNRIDFGGLDYGSVFPVNGTEDTFYGTATEDGVDMYYLFSIDGTVLLEKCDKLWPTYDGYVFAEQYGYFGIVDSNGNWVYKTEGTFGARPAYWHMLFY